MRFLASGTYLACLLLVGGCAAEGDGLGPGQLLPTDSGSAMDAAIADEGGFADAASTADAGGADAISSDAVPTDVGRPPPSDISLGEGLACRLNNDEQLRAAVRFVACTDNNRATVSGLVEAFDAGLMGDYSFGNQSFLSFPVRQGCSFWQCAAAANSCADFERCQPAELDPLGMCQPISAGTVSCVGDVISYCARTGPELIADCSVFGAQCRNGACEKDGCTFGTAFDPGLMCSSDGSKLQVNCEGTFEMNCSDWVEGSQCSSFAIQGELPTSWCSPDGRPVAGAYEGLPGSCGHGAYLFDTVTRGYTQFNCFSEGFNGCDADGSGCRSL